MKVNKMFTFSVPRFEEDKKIVEEMEVKNKEEQYQKIHEILKELLPIDQS